MYGLCKGVSLHQIEQRSFSLKNPCLVACWNLFSGRISADPWVHCNSPQLVFPVHVTKPRKQGLLFYSPSKAFIGPSLWHDLALNCHYTDTNKQVKHTHPPDESVYTLYFTLYFPLLFLPFFQQFISEPVLWHHAWKMWMWIKWIWMHLFLGWKDLSGTLQKSLRNVCYAILQSVSCVLLVPRHAWRDTFEEVLRCVKLLNESDSDDQ